MRTESLCISVFRVASGPRVKLACCKSALTPLPTPLHRRPPPVVYSTDRSKAVVLVLVLLFVALWFTLRGDSFYVLLCVILFLCFSVLLALQLPRLRKRELILVHFVCLVCACLVLSVSSSSWCLGGAAVCLDIMRQTACLVVHPIMLMAMLHSLIARRRFGPQTQ